MYSHDSSALSLYDSASRLEIAPSVNGYNMGEDDSEETQRMKKVPRLYGILLMFDGVK
jgi:hypothetical protein